MFQRTANYAIPAHNAPLTPDYQRAIKADYPALRARARQNMTGIDFDYSDAAALETPPEERTREYERRWQRGGLSFLGAYKDLMVDQEANDTAAEFVRAKIREKVRDPEAGRAAVAEEHHRLQAAVHRHRLLRDLQPAERDAGRRQRERRSRPSRGRACKVRGQEYEVDAIVFATGFDAMTGALLKIDIRGRGGLALREKWREGPRTYLGLAMAGFPNLFTITGPGSPSVLTNMLPTIEQHVDWIADTLGYLRERGLGAHRAERAGRGGLGRPRRRAGRPHAALHLRLLVSGRQHPRQAARVHALYRRLPALHREMQRGRRERVRGLCGGVRIRGSDETTS